MGTILIIIPGAFRQILALVNGKRDPAGAVIFPADRGR